jgi:UDP-N-acetylglucosamine transferase subunit ALG13
MIFLTIGSQKFQFNRLIRKIDELVAEKEITDNIVAQIGYSDYRPRNFNFKGFMEKEQFVDIISSSNLVITHGGTGAIINAIKHKKKVIAVPRLAKYNEHVDNHQTQILKQFGEMRYIVPCYKLNELSNKIKQIETTNLRIYTSNTDKVIDDLSQFINKL